MGREYVNVVEVIGNEAGRRYKEIKFIQDRALKEPAGQAEQSKNTMRLDEDTIVVKEETPDLLVYKSNKPFALVSETNTNIEVYGDIVDYSGVYVIGKEERGTIRKAILGAQSEETDIKIISGILRVGLISKRYKLDRSIFDDSIEVHDLVYCGRVDEVSLVGADMRNINVLYNTFNNISKIDISSVDLRNLAELGNVFRDNLEIVGESLRVDTPLNKIRIINYGIGINQIAMIARSNIKNSDKLLDIINYYEDSRDCKDRVHFSIKDYRQLIQNRSYLGGAVDFKVVDNLEQLRLKNKKLEILGAKVVIFDNGEMLEYLEERVDYKTGRIIISLEIYTEKPVMFDDSVYSVKDNLKYRLSEVDLGLVRRLDMVCIGSSVDLDGATLNLTEQSLNLESDILNIDTIKADKETLQIIEKDKKKFKDKFKR